MALPAKRRKAPITEFGSLLRFAGLAVSGMLGLAVAYWLFGGNSKHDATFEADQGRPNTLVLEKDEQPVPHVSPSPADAVAKEPVPNVTESEPAGPPARPGTFAGGNPSFVYGKAAVPTDAIQKETVKTVKEVYGDEYARATTDAQKRALATRLRLKAQATQVGQVGQFVLFRLARDIATQAADELAAFQAIDGMDAYFQIDALEMKAAVLAKIAATAQSAAQHEALAAKAIGLSRVAVAKDNFPVARQLNELAIQEAMETANNAIINQTTQSAVEIEEIAKPRPAGLTKDEALKRLGRPSPPNASSETTAAVVIANPVVNITSPTVRTTPSRAAVDQNGSTRDQLNRKRLGHTTWTVSVVKKEVVTKYRSQMVVSPGPTGMRTAQVPFSATVTRRETETVRGTLVSYKGTDVTIRGTEEATFAYAKFSKADQQFLDDYRKLEREVSSDPLVW